ncbi:MAG: hypothetical protein IBX55_19940 [Methyloprofundus sp.]|nr:hypothetical protein [Methyloprofundus sp.]
MNKPVYKDWLGLDVVEDYEKFCQYIYPRLETTANKHNWFKTAVRSHCFEVLPKLLYEAIKIKQHGKINALDTALAYARWQMRSSFTFGTRMLTNKQHEVAETLLNVVGGKIGAMKKNIKLAQA